MGKRGSALLMIIRLDAFTSGFHGHAKESLRFVGDKFVALKLTKIHNPFLRTYYYDDRVKGPLETETIIWERKK